MKYNRRKLVLQSSFLVFLLTMQGCFVYGNRENLTLSSTVKKKIELDATLTSVNVANNTVTIQGSGLSKATIFQIQGTGVDETLKIDSQSDTQIIASTLNNFSLLLGETFNLIISSAEAQATYTVTFTLQDGVVTASKLAAMGATAGQVLKFNGTAWAPASLNEAQIYAGTWDASNNIGGVPDLNVVSSTAGEYYIASHAGTLNAVAYAVGDWIISDGYEWQKVEASKTSVTSFQGRKGIVVLTPADYVSLKNTGTNKITGSSINDLADIDLSTAPTDGQVLVYETAGGLHKWVAGAAATGGITLTSLSANSPLVYNNTTGVFSLTTADLLSLPLTGLSSGSGALAATDTLLAGFGKLMSLPSDYVSKSSGATITTGTIALSGTAMITVPTATGVTLSEVANVTYVNNAVAANGVWNKGASSSINYTAGNVGIGTTSPVNPLQVENDNIGTIYNNAAISVVNSTAATSGTPQNVSIKLTGQGWNGSASNPMDWVMVGDGMTNNNPTFRIYNRKNSGSWYEILNIDSNGQWGSPIKYNSYANGQTLNLGYQLGNAAQSTAITNQYAPYFLSYASGWKTASTAASQYMSVGTVVAPEAGVTNPVGVLKSFYGTNTMTPTEANELVRYEWGDRLGVVFNKQNISGYKSVFNGNVGISTTTPLTSLEVAGSVLVGAPPTSLTTTVGAHLSTDTTINAVSTVGYPVSGVLYITDGATMQEAVTYTGTTATSFIGVTRGRYNSTSTTIPAGAIVDIMQLGVSKGGSNLAPNLFITSTKGVGFGVIPPYWQGTNSIYNGGQFFTSGTFVVANTVSYGASTVSTFGNAVNSTSDYWRLSTNNLERFRSDGSGNIGINNPAPRGPLEVSKQVNTKLSTSINAAVTTMIVPANTFPASGTLVVDSEQMTYTGGGTTTFTVTRGANATTAAAHNVGATIGLYGASTFIVASSGSVGIGTTSPLSLLDLLFANGSISNNILNRGIVSEYYGVGAYGGKGGISLLAGGTQASPTAVSVNDISSLAQPIYYDGSTWRVGSRIDSYVTGVTNATSVASGLKFSTGTATGSATGGSFTGITEAMRIDQNGNVGIGLTNPTYQLQLSTDSAAKPGTSAWTIASDARLKNIRAQFLRGLDAMEGIHPIYFQYKEGNELGLPTDKEYVGIIAQEAMKVVPESIQTDDKGFLHVTNDSIIWTMFNGIKELYGQFKELVARIISLENKDAAKDKKIKELEQRLEKIEKALKSK